jgi:hypothetical protein
VEKTRVSRIICWVFIAICIVGNIATLVIQIIDTVSAGSNTTNATVAAR